MNQNTINYSEDTKRRDVKPEASQILDWDPEQRHESIHTVYQRAENHALNAIYWYLGSKKAKKNYAQYLRLGTIILTAIAGLLPIISQISGLSPVFSSIALGLAALCLAIDKFFRFFICVDALYCSRAPDSAMFA